jgi:hypothetical protein
VLEEGVPRVDGGRVTLPEGAGACVGWLACGAPADPGEVPLAVADGSVAGVKPGPGPLPVPALPMPPELVPPKPCATAMPVAAASVRATAAVGIRRVARARGRALMR